MIDKFSWKFLVRNFIQNLPGSVENMEKIPLPPSVNMACTLASFAKLNTIQLFQMVIFPAELPTHPSRSVKNRGINSFTCKLKRCS
jgi:hypothetical protein